MRRASAKTTLDTYGHLWPDADESTRFAIGEVITERMDSAGTTTDGLRTEDLKQMLRCRSRHYEPLHVEVELGL